MEMLASHAIRRKGGIIVHNIHRTAFLKYVDCPLTYAIAISMFFPFMLFHSTNAAPTMLTAPAATLT